MSERAAPNLLEPNDEKFLLLFPFTVLLACPIFWALGWTYSDQNQEAWLNFVQSVFGLTAAHNAFTYVMISLPEIRQWRSAQKKDPLRKWYLLFGMIAFVFTAHRTFIWHLGHAQSGPLTPSSAKSLGKIFSATLLFAFWGTNFWHTFRQCFGLSMLYNKSQQNSGQTRKAEELERFFYMGASISGALGLGLCAAAPSWRHLSTPLLGISILFCLGVLYASLRYPEPLRKTKVLFNFRIFLFPFAGSLPLAATGTAFNHSIEYWYVFKRTMKKSVAPEKSRLYLLAGSWIAFVVFVSLFKPRGGGLPPLARQFQHPSLAMALFLIISPTITFLHYILDGEIFRFSEETNRKYIAPLLLGEN